MLVGARNGLMGLIYCLFLVRRDIKLDVREDGKLLPLMFLFYFDFTFEV